MFPFVFGMIRDNYDDDDDNEDDYDDDDNEDDDDNDDNDDAGFYKDAFQILRNSWNFVGLQGVWSSDTNKSGGVFFLLFFLRCNNLFQVAGYK